MSKEEQLESVEEEIKKLFSKTESKAEEQPETKKTITNFEEEHQNLSRALGIVTDDSIAGLEKLIKFCPLSLYERYMAMHVILSLPITEKLVERIFYAVCLGCSCLFKFIFY